MAKVVRKKVTKKKLVAKKKVLRHGRGSAPGERRGGRQKGTPNKRSAQGREIWEDSGAKHPLLFLLEQMEDENRPIRLRMRAARDALPYVLARLSSVELSDVEGRSLGETFAEAVVKLNQRG